MGLGNALLPVGVKERFADRPVFATGVYAAGINIGATASAAAAVPLAHALGRLARPAARLLGGDVRRCSCSGSCSRASSAATSRPRRRGPLALPWRSPLAWRLVAAFFFMSATYYGLNAWLPGRLRRAGLERG